MSCAQSPELCRLLHSSYPSSLVEVHTPQTVGGVLQAQDKTVAQWPVTVSCLGGADHPDTLIRPYRKQCGQKHDGVKNWSCVLFLRRSGRACGPDRGGSGSATGDTDDIHDERGAFWSFSKVPFKHSLLTYDSHEMEDVAIRMFNSTLVYAGIESAGKSAFSASEVHRFTPHHKLGFSDTRSNCFSCSGRSRHGGCGTNADHKVYGE